MNRKDAIKTMILSSVAVTSGVATAASKTLFEGIKNAGSIKHSVCRWCFNKVELPDLCREAKAMGIQGIDLVGPSNWNILKENGMECSMASPESFNLTKGFNDLSLHAELQKLYQDLIVKASENGIKNVICFSGNRNGISDDQGLENCAVGLEPLVKLAEKHNVVLAMELLNSKLNHPDYQCDHTAWGVKLSEKLGSENFKLLYDIYHMQIMEGDIIATIRKYNKYISHYHTAGVPGRNEINESQELFYPAIMRAIKETGFNGYVAQEFIPKGVNPFASLKEAIKICDV